MTMNEVLRNNLKNFLPRCRTCVSIGIFSLLMTTASCGHKKRSIANVPSAPARYRSRRSVLRNEPRLLSSRFQLVM